MRKKQLWLKQFFSFLVFQNFMIHDGLWQMSLLKRADHNSKSALIKTHQLIKIFRAPFPCDTFLLSEHVHLYGKLLKFHFFNMKFTWFFFYPIIYIVKNYLVLMMHAFMTVRYVAVLLVIGVHGSTLWLCVVIEALSRWH